MAYEDEVLADTPVLYWRFTENAGTTASDSAGNSNDGTYSSAAMHVWGHLNDSTGGAEIVGTFPKYVKSAVGAAAWNTDSDLAEWTFEIIVKVTAFDNVGDGYTHFWGSGDAYPFIWADGTGLLACDSGSERLIGPVLELDTVYHLCATYDGTDAVLYVDGVEVDSAAEPFTGDGSATQYFMVGFDNATRNATGVYDEAAFYNHALSPSRVAAHYAEIPYFKEGTLQSFDNSWSDVNAGLHSGGGFLIAVNESRVGSEKPSSEYYSYIRFFSFDLSDVPSDVTNVYFQANWSLGATLDQDVVLNIAPHDYGSALAADDWLNSTALSALTPIYTISSNGLGALFNEDIFFEIPIGDLDLNGENKFVAFLDVQADNVTPAGSGSLLTNLFEVALVVKRAYIDPGVINSYETEVVADSPEVYWRLDETSGTTANDSSGNGNDGTYTNSPVLNQPSLLASGDGKAVDFASGLGWQDNYVESINDFSEGATFSSGVAFECIVNVVPEDIDDFYGVPIGFEQDIEIDIELYNAQPIKAADGFYKILFYGGHGGSNPQSMYTFGVLEETTHIIAQYDGTSQYVLYINGDAYWYVRSGNTHTYEAPILDPGVGNNYLYGGGDHFSDSVTGIVDELTYYSHALSDERARIHYKASAALTTGAYATEVLADGPEVYFRLNELTGTIAVDSSGNGNDGIYSVDASGMTTAGLLVGDSDAAAEVSGASGQYVATGVSGTPAYLQGVTEWTMEIVYTCPAMGTGGDQLWGSIPSAPYLNFNTVNISIAGFNPAALIESPDPPVDGEIYHVCATFNGTVLTLYVNGASVGTSLSETAFDNATGPWSVTYPPNNSIPFTADEVAFYSHALTSERVYAHYAASAAVGPPTVTSVSPDGDVLAGGVSVTISGTNFTGATAVTFGVTAATSFSVDSDTTITAVSPAHAAGTVNITVTTPQGVSDVVAEDEFTYAALVAPIVTGVSPEFGPAAGGTSVTIAGVNLSTVTSVKFGTTNATSFIINSSTSITAISPAHSIGIVNITVISPGGISETSTDDIFLYTSLPSIDTVNPTTGDEAGGTSVAVNGVQFTGATAVTFGSTPAQSFVVNSDILITAVSPPHIPGTVDIRVTTPVGTNP